jgi:UPF0716 family protein affecting phage T7 exclusion
VKETLTHTFGGRMKNILVLTISVIIMVIPGLFTAMLIWIFIYPKHRKLIIQKFKGGHMIQKVIGKINKFDSRFAEPVSYADLVQLDHKDRINKAFAYLDRQYEERVTSQRPMAIVMAFAFGAITVAAFWFVVTQNI